jgi:hypothetical protein
MIAAVESAAHEAAAFARSLLGPSVVPSFAIVWVNDPRACFGQAVSFGDGGPSEIRLRGDLTASQVRGVVFHEMQHLVDHRLMPQLTAAEAEKRATEFERLAAEEYERRGGHQVTYEEWFAMGGITGNIKGERARQMLEAHRAWRAGRVAKVDPILPELERPAAPAPAPRPASNASRVHLTNACFGLTFPVSKMVSRCFRCGGLVFSRN